FQSHNSRSAECRLTYSLRQAPSCPQGLEPDWGVSCALRHFPFTISGDPTRFTHPLISAACSSIHCRIGLCKIGVSANTKPRKKTSLLRTRRAARIKRRNAEPGEIRANLSGSNQRNARQEVQVRVQWALGWQYR